MPCEYIKVLIPIYTPHIFVHVVFYTKEVPVHSMHAYNTINIHIVCSAHILYFTRKRPDFNSILALVFRCITLVAIQRQCCTVMAAVERIHKHITLPSNRYRYKYTTENKDSLLRLLRSLFMYDGAKLIDPGRIRKATSFFFFNIYVLLFLLQSLCIFYYRQRIVLVLRF